MTHSPVCLGVWREEGRRGERAEETGGQAHQQQLVFEWMRSTSSILWPVILTTSQLVADACAHLWITEEGRGGWAWQCGGVDVEVEPLGSHVLVLTLLSSFILFIIHLLHNAVSEADSRNPHNTR